MSKLKTAVVGVGALGRHHLKWMSQLTDSELVGVYDIDQTRCSEYAEEYKIKAFETIAQLADEVEAVSIVVPTTVHYEIASELIKAGIHCLIEKPVTLNVEQAEELIKLAAEHKVKVTVGQIERFNPAVAALSNTDLKPSFIEAHRLAGFDPRGTDVAVILDLMIHDIDLVLSFVDSKIKDIQASGVAVISDMIDIANARLTFENGCVANLTASRISLNPMRKLRLFQKSGYYSLDLAKKQADIYRMASPDESVEGFRMPLGKSDRDVIYNKIEDNGADMLGAELASFLTAIKNDSDVAVSVYQASEALRVALEVEKICKESLQLHEEMS